MNLCPTRIGEKGSALMGAPNSRRVTTHRQRRQIIDLAESASAQHDRVGGVAFHRAGMLSPDGTCKSFDARADGYGRGEGAAYNAGARGQIEAMRRTVCLLRAEGER